jgi:hypothetical protein
MRFTRALLCVAAIPVAALCASIALPQTANPIEIVVVQGRVPGPPLWRVLNGDNVLYIFPALSPVPEDIDWDTGRVAFVLEESQEVILEPDIEADFSLAMMLNPINLFRGARLTRNLSRNPDDETLADVLPAELHTRYEALKTLYFPRDRNIDLLRPVFAGPRVTDQVLDEAGLESGEAITKQLDRLIRRNRHLEETPIEVEMDLTGSFRSLAERAEALVASLSPEQELECFEQQITRMESELDAMKNRANAWAQGSIDDFRGIPLPGDDSDACLLLLNESSEFETIEQLREELDRRWLAAAERTLAVNASTLAILDIVELLREDGLLATLRARGYEVVEP